MVLFEIQVIWNLFVTLQSKYEYGRENNKRGTTEGRTGDAGMQTG